VCDTSHLMANASPSNRQTVLRASPPQGGASCTDETEDLHFRENESPSRASKMFATCKSLSSPEVRTDACLAEVVDSALRAQHLVSEKYRPSSEALLQGLPPLHRQETLLWLLQAFDVMQFNDSLLFDAALVLDRYYATCPHEDGPGAAQRSLLAAVCTALKTGSPIDLQLPLKQLIMHLGRDQVPFEEVLSAELLMLRRLKFHVGTATARDFLEGFWERMSSEGVNPACRNLAEFLLQLTIMDAPLHYRFPHAILAASCLILALQSTRAPQSAYAGLLEDVALHFNDTVHPRQTMMDCVQRVHQFWVRNLNQPQHDQNAYLLHLCKKFKHPKRNSVSAMVPPPSPPPSLLPTNSPSAISATGLDDVQEAIIIVHQSLSCHDAFLAPSWATSLSAKLVNLAECSARVRGILVKHGWSVGGRFRRFPDREALLRDLLSERGGSGGRQAPAEQHQHQHQHSRSLSAAGRAPQRQPQPQRPRRASSWSGFRPPSRTAGTSAAGSGPL